MKILHNLEPFSQFELNFLFIDTNILILAYQYPQIIKDIFVPLKENGCDLVTIPSVIFEFTRGSRNVEEFNNKNEFVKQLISNPWPVEKFLKKIDEFTLVFHRLNPKMKYTDFLLCAAIYKFPGTARIITQDHGDFAVASLSRSHIITLDNYPTIRNLGIYEFDYGNYNKVAEKILKI